MSPTLTLTPSARRTFDTLAADCRRVFDDRLVAVVATGPASSVVFAHPIEAADLEALTPLVDAWERDGLETPLLLTPEEFRRSLDTFPVEYQALMNRHAVIVGTPPFAEAVVPPEQLRRACEVQAKGHLIHLRQGWLHARGRDAALARLLVESAKPLRAVLANVARLHGVHHEHDLAQAGARVAGLPAALVDEVLALDDAPEQARHLVRRLPDYLAAAEQLWSFVDRWSIES
ncbi:MAG: hypothetical protein IT184_10390 [Acidobacteria bacterium]|nr:hypothetical protein [Acidobacteriota bacterium]